MLLKWWAEISGLVAAAETRRKMSGSSNTLGIATGGVGVEVRHVYGWGRDPHGLSEKSRRETMGEAKGNTPKCSHVKSLIVSSMHKVKASLERKSKTNVM